MDQFNLTVNLWETLTAVAYAQKKGLDLPGFAHDSESRQVKSVQAALDRAAHWNGQELELTAHADGWEIRIFSCYEDEPGERSDLLRLRVNKDGSVVLVTTTGPVQVEGP